ncbi:hypothetical protein CCMSSC00406_0010048 [Pleurotus cornucopiae]|uniref:Uncharacterized protein n=1 Tax=Pleurotus cornucopiae TaxID=5321 RepID=A0ACB7ILA1_PLECO|nr:hypothetical protein CCMSSC00406_0010048 [Pleurotus cornucopiae]
MKNGRTGRGIEDHPALAAEPWTRNGCSSTGTSIEGSLKVQAGAETCELITGIVTEDEERTHGQGHRRPSGTGSGTEDEEEAPQHGSKQGKGPSGTCIGTRTRKGLTIMGITGMTTGVER